MRVLFLSVSIWLLYRLLMITWRTRLIDESGVAHDRGPTNVFAHWHGDEYTVVQMVGRLHIATMTSTSEDGRIVDRVIRLLGGRTCAGSSSRGGARALKGLIRLCRQGQNASMAPDGPRGPRHKVKPGVFSLARSTDGVIIPVGVAAAPTHVFRRTWNGAHLPLPFARVLIYLAPARTVGNDRNDDDARQLEATLALAHARANELLIEWR